MPVPALPKSGPRRSRWRSAVLLAALLAPVLGACATPPADPQARADYDAATIPPSRPTATSSSSISSSTRRHQAGGEVDRDDVPVVVQNRLHDFLINLRGPVIEINDILQGNFSRGWVTLQRFVVNTTVGGLGLFDVASDWEIAASRRGSRRDLGYGASATVPYVMLPILARRPCATLSAPGTLFVLDPLNWVGAPTLMYAELVPYRRRWRRCPCGRAPRNGMPGWQARRISFTPAWLSA